MGSRNYMEMTASAPCLLLAEGTPPATVDSHRFTATSQLTQDVESRAGPLPIPVGWSVGQPFMKQFVGTTAPTEFKKTQPLPCPSC